MNSRGSRMAEMIDAALATAGKPCELGNDPSKYLERFEDWYEHASLLADSIGVKDATQKLKLILLWGGRHFRRLVKDAEVKTDGETPDTLASALTKIRKQCGEHVNLSMSMFKLMHARQGTKTVTEFSREIDDLAERCQFTTHPYTKDRAMKDAFIFGTSDDKLRQEALAKDFTYAQVMKSALGYEQSRRASGAIKQTSGEDVRKVTYNQEEVDAIVARVIAGKYSNRQATPQRQGMPSQRTQPARCRNCPPNYRPHGPGRCPAAGKTCAACKGKNHFAASQACPAAHTTVKAVETSPSTYSYDTYSDDDTVGFVEVISVGMVTDTHQNNTIEVRVNGIRLILFVDSGCKKTLIPYTHYQPQLGELRPSNIRLRPYGVDHYLQVKGEIPAVLTSANGAKHTSVVYVVEGHLVEPLLGDEDAKALGILCINPGGHVPASSLQNPATPEQPEDLAVAGITANLRAAGFVIQTAKNPEPEISVEEQNRINAIVERHPDVVHKDLHTAGLLSDHKRAGDASVKFHMDLSVPPVTARYHPPPLAYQERLSQHLQELRDSDKIEDIDPNENCPWISNVVITEKKQAGQIRMNIDMREPNKAILRTQRHIDTIQEIRHKLKDATRFSEIDLSHGYHQIPLDEDSRQISTFQSHEGLHRFKVLFFGASPASDLFHEKIKTAMNGVPGCVSIHDNILVWGTTAEEHEANLETCLQRMEDRNLTARYSKCNFGKTSVSWFGWIFSADGMSADPRKIQSILEAGRPQNCEDIKSFLQACQFNAKFMLDSDLAYAQITAPLRALTRKGATFNWSQECEDAYNQIIEAMTSETTLRPFDPKLKTKLVTDAGPTGIAASIFQELPDGTWVPIDHTSRSLTACEMKYSQIEKESLAQAWGMTIHRYYLLGIHFESFTDHQPLIPIYSGRKKGNARVERHRLKVQGFQYDMKFLPGKDNPCDYQSRHPLPLESFTERQLEDMVIDVDDELCINKIITDDLPDAITLHMIQTATKEDPVSQKLIQLKPYRQMLHELTYTRGVILRGDKLVIPDTEFAPGVGSLRQVITDIAHEGHQGIVKCKQLLRSKVWFPNLDDMVEAKVSGCIACQATTFTPRRDPLKPSPLPQRPWQNIASDLWGPLPTGGHVLVLVDEYTRYPEIEFVHSTSADAVVPHLDRIFSTHGFPEQLKTDGGPPFNGTDSHGFQMYMRWAGIKHITVSPEDPEANGLAENFMKMVKKVWHTAQIEKKNFWQEIFKYLRHYRSTPHSSTGRPPAELLFNRKVRTRLPSFQEPAHDPQVQLRHTLAKAAQKAYKDAKSNVKPHDIQPGDLVLLLQKDSKKQRRYDPQPYTVTQVQGSQITAQRGNKIRLRDAQMFKKVMPHATTNYHDMRYPLNLHTHETSDFSWDKKNISGTTTLPHAPPAQPNRTDRAQHPGPSAPPRSGSPPRRPGTPSPAGPDAHRPARPEGPLPARPSAPPPDRPGSSLSAGFPAPPPARPGTSSSARSNAPLSARPGAPPLARPGASSSARSKAPRPARPGAPPPARPGAQTPALPGTSPATRRAAPPRIKPIGHPPGRPGARPQHKPAAQTPPQLGATATLPRPTSSALVVPPAVPQDQPAPDSSTTLGAPPIPGPRQPKPTKNYQYPNKHLDPNIDVTLQPGDRQRRPPGVYDANSGIWH